MSESIQKIKSQIRNQNTWLKKQLWIENNNMNRQLLQKICDTSLRYYILNFEGENYNVYNKYIQNILDKLYNNFFLKEQIQLQDILDLHTAIMKPLKKEKIKNMWILRKTPIVTKWENLSKFKIQSFLSPKKVKKYSINLINYYNENIQKDSLTTTTTFFINFMMYIHPFENGNWKVLYPLLDTLLWKKWFLPVFLFHKNNRNKRTKVLDKYTLENNSLQKSIENFYKCILSIYKDYQIT